MFDYYNLTDQLRQIICVVNTVVSKERVICGIPFKFIRVPNNRMYGYEKMKIQDTEIFISSREKTLIDLLYYNKPVGGIIPATEIFKQNVFCKKCNLRKLIKFAACFPNVTTRKRIGVILEGLGIEDSFLKPLIKSVKNTAISSLTGSRKGSLNKKWNVIINGTKT